MWALAVLAVLGMFAAGRLLGDAPATSSPEQVAATARAQAAGTPRQPPDDATRAVALALALHDAEARAIAGLEGVDGDTRRRDPTGVARLTWRHLSHVLRHLEEARGLRGADSAAVRYWHDAEHGYFIRRLLQADSYARDMDFLDGIHNTLDLVPPTSIGLQRARQLAQLRDVGAFDNSVEPWAGALLDEISGDGDRRAAQRARRLAIDSWGTVLSDLGPPPAGQSLGTYLRGVEPERLEVLQSHSYFGPILQRLEVPVADT